MGPRLAQTLARLLLPSVLHTVVCSGYLDARQAPFDRRLAYINDHTCGTGTVKLYCSRGQCCSESGYCGTGTEYCGGSQCQVEFSDSCDAFFGPKGPDTDVAARPKIGKVSYGTTIKSCSTPGTIALTFDDGPWNFTDHMLDVLDSLNVTATFFITGSNRGKGHIDDPSTGWPDVLRRMYNAGHQIASHTWTHRDLDKIWEFYSYNERHLKRKIRHTEVMFNEMAFRNLFGWFPTYIRPPYLSCSSKCLKFLDERGYHVISANVDTKDYENDDPSLIAKSKRKFDKAVSKTVSENSYIVLAHDVHYQTVVNLTAHMVLTARERGYKLVTVGECLGDPKENWYRPAHIARRAPGPAPGWPRLRTSINQRCDDKSGFMCHGSLFANCCSYFGICGSSPKHCGTGCNSARGDCDPTGEGMTNSTNDLCGSTFEATCLYNKEKSCCSQYGYCGSQDQHCGQGCQEKYGKCHGLRLMH